MWNFLEEAGSCYGYVMTGKFSGIDLTRINSNQNYKAGDELENIDIVFIAKRPKPEQGQVVVGLYRNATVFHKQYRKRRVKSNKKIISIDYLCEVDAENSFLLPEKRREFEIPQGKGLPGRSNVWYGDITNKDSQNLLDRLRKYIDGRKEKEKNKKTKKKKNADKDIISKIERAAVRKTWETYEKRGYELRSVEKDKRGWDLEASKKKRKLLIEVKGHFGNVIQFELTPNEYEKMQAKFKDYRVSVVRNALIEPEISIFSPKYTEGEWVLVEENNGEKVMLKEKVAAKASLIEIE